MRAPAAAQLHTGLRRRAYALRPAAGALLGWLLLAVPAFASVSVTSLADAYFDEYLALHPSDATESGDHRYDDRLEDSATAVFHEQELAMARRYREKLKQIDAAKLDESEIVTYDVLSDRLETTLAGAPFADYSLPINQMAGIQEVLIRFGSGDSVQPFKTVGDYEAFLKRCDAFLVWADHAIETMRTAAQSGITLPRPVVGRIADMQRGIGAMQVESSPFWQPIQRMPAGFSAADKARLTQAWREKIQGKVLPTYARIADFIEKEYLPRSRTTVAWSALPNGAAWYRYEIRRSTTLSPDPEEVHALGLREVTRLRSEMDAVRVKVGFKGDLLAFFHFVQTDPQFYFKSGPAMVAAYEGVKRRVDARLPTLFRTLPKADYVIREMEPYRAEHIPGAQYQAAPPDGSRPGTFFVNTHDLMGLPSYITESLSLHEASPGHHLQNEIAHELQNLPRLQRFEHNSAYGEGWALYSEALGKELGLYTDPYQWYGHLTEQMLRAMRLVVDTGLHAKGWAREQAVRYMLDNSSMAKESIEIEVDRYIMWPGQALSYQLGRIKIGELRSRAERELGSRFDIKDFHDQLLNSGPLPMDVLEKKINRWIADRRKPATH